MPSNAAVTSKNPFYINHSRSYNKVAYGNAEVPPAVGASRAPVAYQMTWRARLGPRCCLPLIAGEVGARRRQQFIAETGRCAPSRTILITMRAPPPNSRISTAPERDTPNRPQPGPVAARSSATRFACSVKRQTRPSTVCAWEA